MVRYGKVKLILRSKGMMNVELKSLVVPADPLQCLQKISTGSCLLVLSL